MTAPVRSRVPWIVASAGVLLLGTLALASARPGSVDDAFILLTYARGLATEGRLVDYAGEGAVEGFTSVLDLALKSLAVAAFPGDPVRTLWLATGALYALALLAGVAVAARLSAGRRPEALAGAAALALCPGLAEGASYLLGTPLYVGLLALGALLLPVAPGRPRSELCAGGLALAIALARPEGIPVAGVLLGVRTAAGGGRERWLAPLVLCAGVAALLAWRHATFGTWAPNSYHAKTSDVRWLEVRDGFAYLGQFLAGGERAGVWRRAGGGIVAVVVLAWATVALPLLRRAPFDGREARRRCLGTAGAALVALAAVVVSGGDAYRGARFLAPVALLALVAALQAACAARGAARVAAVASLAAVAGLRAAEVLPGAGAKLAAVRSAPWSEEDFACGRRIARRLARVDPPVRVAQRHFQALKYFAPELAVVDLTGLNHGPIARLPAPGPVRFGRDAVGYAVERGIEVIHLDHLWTRPHVMAREPLAELLAVPARGERVLGAPLPGGAVAGELVARYLPATWVDACGRGGHFNVLVRADAAERLRAAGFAVGE